MGGLIEWFSDPANWTGGGGVPARVAEHVLLSAVAMVIAGAIALPVAVWLGHIGKGGILAINVGNVGRAIPTYAVLVLLTIGPLGRGVPTTVVALVLFALPPLLTNAYVGMREVDAAVRDSARGMGMSGAQLVRGVEIPLAAPMIMNGVRLAAVQVVATATIAGLVGGPGLGRIITSGFANRNQPQVLAGAILVALIALVVEVVLAWAQQRTDPRRRSTAAAASAPAERRASVV